MMLAAGLVVALAAAGCGGDDGGQSKEQLLIAQANADVHGFCSASKAKKGAIYDDAYVVMVDAVGTLIGAHQKNPNQKVFVDKKHPNMTVAQIVNKDITDLKRCGPDGRQQSRRLQRAVTAG
jgi:hypothetical protein